MSKRVFPLIIFLSLVFLLTTGALAYATTTPSFFNPMGTGTSASSTFDEMFTRVLSWLFPLSLMIAVLMIIIGAYYFVLSGGNPEKVVIGRKIVIYAMIGIAIIIASRGIVELVRVILGI